MYIVLETYRQKCSLNERANLEKMAGLSFPLKEAPLWQWPNITLQIIIGASEIGKPINFYDHKHIEALEEEVGGVLRCSTLYSKRGGLPFTHEVSEIINVYDFLSQKDINFCPIHPEDTIIWETPK